MRDEADALEEAAAAEEQQASIIAALRDEKGALEDRLSLARMQVGKTIEYHRDGSTVELTGKQIAARVQAGIEAVDAELRRIGA